VMCMTRPTLPSAASLRIGHCLLRIGLCPLCIGIWHLPQSRAGRKTASAMCTCYFTFDADAVVSRHAFKESPPGEGAWRDPGTVDLLSLCAYVGISMPCCTKYLFQSCCHLSSFSSVYMARA